MFAALLEHGVDPDEFDAVQKAVAQGGGVETVDKAVLTRLGVAGIRARMAEHQRVADDHLAAALVASWSYGLPVSAESMLELPARARALLVDACKSLAPDLTPDFEPNMDEASPTTPSSV